MDTPRQPEARFACLPVEGPVPSPPPGWTWEGIMAEALAEARHAGGAGEVPVGAVVADPLGRIVGRGRNAPAADGRYSVLRIADRCAMRLRVLWRSQGAVAERAVSMQAKPPCKGGLNSPRSRAHCLRRRSARSDRIRRQSCDCRAMRQRERNAPSRTGARLGLLWPRFT